MAKILFRRQNFNNRNKCALYSKKVLFITSYFDFKESFRAFEEQVFYHYYFLLTVHITA